MNSMADKLQKLKWMTSECVHYLQDMYLKFNGAVSYTEIKKKLKVLKIWGKKFHIYIEI